MKNHKPTWCPGCGDFPILKVAKKVIHEQFAFSVKEYVIVSGIGQAAKLPHYFEGCNVFSGLHGRALPAATGIKLANHRMKVLLFSGDGDLLAEGGNHFIHAVRRNIGITCFLHNNQVYGLTKGQASPTSDKGYITAVQHYGVISKPFFPLRVALALGAGFVARTFAGNSSHMAAIMTEAINYQGFALVDILQPCVTFNKKNTYDWYRKNTTILDDSHDCTDKKSAMELAGEWEKTIPLGIIYKKDSPSYEAMLPKLEGETLVDASQRRPQQDFSSLWNALM